MDDFAPPTVPPQPAPISLPRFAFDSAFGEGWRAFSGRYGFFLGMVVIVGLLVFALSMITGYIDEQLHFPLTGLLAAFFVNGPLTAGCVYAAAAEVRGTRPRFDDILIGFRRYWPVVGVTALITLITYAIILIAALGGGLAVALGSLLGEPLLGMIVLIPVVIAAVVAAAFLSIRLTFAGVVAIDPLVPPPPFGVIDSLKQSWRMTSGYGVQLFLLGLVLGLMMLATVFLLVLPAIFFGGPLMAAVWGAAYATLAEERLASPVAPTLA